MAGILTLVEYLAIILVLPALLHLDAKRRHYRRLDVFCCLRQTGVVEAQALDTKPYSPEVSRLRIGQNDNRMGAEVGSKDEKEEEERLEELGVSRTPYYPGCAISPPLGSPGKLKPVTEAHNEHVQLSHQKRRERHEHHHHHHHHHHYFVEGTELVAAAAAAAAVAVATASTGELATSAKETSLSGHEDQQSPPRLPSFHSPSTSSKPSQMIEIQYGVDSTAGGSSSQSWSKSEPRKSCCSLAEERRTQKVTSFVPPVASLSSPLHVLPTSWPEHVAGIPVEPSLSIPDSHYPLAVNLQPPVDDICSHQKVCDLAHKYLPLPYLLSFTLIV
ncbi:unnamed protein product [Protopolystoma xenopodis]|uniref:Uncharacterized protein n=1 Tax=Protopolystoma xenopodis TaxID=117903 RepID=A0A3S5A279_9PLAT|nr:unnamed protein product [Protopolystoma xenopodis]